MYAQRGNPRRTPPSTGDDAFAEFRASALFCERCRTAQPVRERRLLYLPDGELWEYLCVVCGASLGTRRTTAGTAGIEGLNR
jgi:hypothetical protein